jgi:hypothetical protein
VNKRRLIKVDLTNKKYGKLTVLNWSKFIGAHRYWLCRCDCGKEKDIAGTHLISGSTKTCGCSQKENKTRQNNNSWKGYGDISGSFFSGIRRGAKERDIKFNITIEYLWELFLKQGKKCALSKLEIELPKRNKEKYTASLDRIDSKKGYEEGNVQWVLGDINWMKNDFSQKYFIDICKKIATNN